jgi:hypothetical protein
VDPLFVQDDHPMDDANAIDDDFGVEDDAAMDCVDGEESQMTE